MNRWKQAALNGYVLATSRPRRRKLIELCRQGRAPVCILFYHRVADHTPNEWTIDNAMFQQQMLWLKKRADMVSLSEAQDRIRNGNDRLAVSITFDDGYADNCDEAIPFLTQQNIPCTYFVSLDFVRTGRPFPHDESTGQPLLPNSIEQLRRMADAGIEIGSHTRNHPDIGAIECESILLDEVVTSAAELASDVGTEINYFAFPFGQPENLSAKAARMADDAGMKGVVSAYGDYNLPGQTNPFHMRRIHGDPEFARLKNWITLDPRKLNHERLQTVLECSSYQPCEVSQ